LKREQHRNRDNWSIIVIPRRSRREIKGTRGCERLSNAPSSEENLRLGNPLNYKRGRAVQRGQWTPRYSRLATRDSRARAQIASRRKLVSPTGGNRSPGPSYRSVALAGRRCRNRSLARSQMSRRAERDVTRRRTLEDAEEEWESRHLRSTDKTRGRVSAKEQARRSIDNDRPRCNESA